MTFADLYGEALNHELGSADTTQLFTTVRRKYAINRAHKEFARLGKVSLARDLVIPLISGVVNTYNLDTASANRFVAFGRAPLRLVVTTIATGKGHNETLTLRSSAYMDEAQAGWRSATNLGHPDTVVYEPIDGINYLFVIPFPVIPATETWGLNVPYAANAADMVGDTDLPFDGRPDTEPFHWALAHFAAAQLERLRKDPDAEKNQIAKFGAYIEDWNAKSIRPPGAHKRVLMQRDYIGESSRVRAGITVQGDPRV
jgi:hypothetical protein